MFFITSIMLPGAGKTTTLYHIVRSNPHLKFLYCVYNKLVFLLYS